MKGESSVHYCDVTGNQIEDEFSMLTVNQHYQERPLKQPSQTFHLSKSVHAFEFERMNENEYHAYRGDSGRVVMITERSPILATHFGQDTADAAMQDLMQTLNSLVEREDPER